MFIRTSSPAQTSAPSDIANIIRTSDLSRGSLQAMKDFKSNPERFFAQNIVDISGVMKSNDRTSTTHMLNDVLKKGYFALIPSENGNNKFHLKPVNVSTTTEAENVIYAHWIPFKSGNVTPGYTDVPKIPHHAPRDDNAIFAFTPGMNGCALEVREHPTRDNYYRIFHNQHPTSQVQTDLIDEIAGSKVDAFTESEYFQHNNALLMPVAANIMHFDNRQGGWAFISQPQGINMHNNAVERMSDSNVIFRYMAE
ncbi:hypothetical protein [Pectobacterium zantedeschiae]|nr:hypothetical protein [Pectobacterium zantedeschiae]